MSINPDSILQNINENRYLRSVRRKSADTYYPQAVAMLCIHMQENALHMKNIKTKVQPAQKTLVENMWAGIQLLQIWMNYLTSAQIPKLKLIAKKMSSFVINPSPVLIRPKYVMELSIAFLVKTRTSSCANLPFLKLPPSYVMNLIEGAMILQF